MNAQDQSYWQYIQQYNQTASDKMVHLLLEACKEAY